MWCAYYVPKKSVAIIFDGEASLKAYAAYLLLAHAARAAVAKALRVEHHLHAGVKRAAGLEQAPAAAANGKRKGQGDRPWPAWDSSPAALADF